MVLYKDVKLWWNKPQQRSIYVSAKEEYGVWGRATGKTQGPIAYRSSHAANVMPRGATGVVGTTYMQLLDRTLPPLIKSWERLGYVEDLHFFVRKKPPAAFKIKPAIYPVLHYEHSITWYNGHVFHLISQDRPGLANGKNVDAIIADEARFLNHQRYMDDIAPINRGNLEYFGQIPEHHMITMFTDMPTDPKGRWILDKREQMDSDIVTKVVRLQYELNILEQRFSEATTTESRKYLYRKIREYGAVLGHLRKGLVYYSEASSLDNIQILGEEQIRQWRRELIWPVFRAAVLNERTITTENGFYHLLDSDYHTYDQFDYGYIESQGIWLPNGLVKDCRMDADLIKGAPIDISLDYNSKIKSLVCGQETRNFYRVLKSMYVKREDRKVLDDLIDEFCTYYKHHDTHHVMFYYDHTANVTDATRLETLADMVTKRFEDNQWTVSRIYIGQQPTHAIRYRMWESILAERDTRFMSVRFNKVNCDSLLTSMQQTGVRVGKNGFEKDKRPEQNSAVKPEDAPHLGDAMDTLYIGKFNTTYGYSTAVGELIVS
ncbi:hypothetical protein FAZ19_19705 [Sphingobacterium alkalisoli]|uniref:Uncharacterized protein n=1 Tax=Sphingobacterium alkalisoli TaxID=1874115 RepID=A0A4U0GUW4_9SPHI|nr:hypothetical protein [Sphingobacterium alkalisoli]TJY62696.1 hypothetical protein FAZ19_19705 [Sphingobacterium alkalisoli]GGH28279.1 hypothetical protein GCM10011418_38820 [Sphingobacterium alkalisoli]